MRKQRNIARQMAGLIFALVAAAGSALGQTPNSWTAIAPNGSGSVSTLAIDPANSNVIYVGAANGVFKSADGGAAWKATYMPRVASIAIDHTNPNNVFAGTIPDGPCTGQRPLYKSSDAGASWSNSASPADCDFGVVVIDPSSPATVYAEATRYIFADLGVMVWKTTDGGATWAQAGYSYAGEGYLALNPGLLIHSSQPQILYAQGYLFGNTTSFGGLFKSTDGGANWIDTSLKVTENDSEAITALAIDPINSNVLYAALEDYFNQTKRILKSVDGGTSWFAINNVPAYYGISSLVVAPDSPRTLYAATRGEGVFKSSDGGAHWDGLNDGLSNRSRNIRTLVIGSGNPRTLLALSGDSDVFRFIESAPSPVPNAIDGTDFFVQQHYADFLNRQPDAEGLAYWTNQITSCGGDAECIDYKRVNVSAAYFLSIEFQQTGYLVYRTYKASYGNLPNALVPLRLNEFLPDTQQIGQGVIVNHAGWEQLLDNNTQNFFSGFVQRSRFTSAYPTSLAPDAFVDQLFLNAEVTPSAGDRQAAINEFGSDSNTADIAARARSLRRVAENSALASQEFNRAFVLMQYFGYLRRNPDDAPDNNFAGYDFWLAKLNQFNGNYIGAEMVKAFLVSTEYRQRFGQP